MSSNRPLRKVPIQGNYGFDVLIREDANVLPFTEVNVREALSPQLFYPTYAGVGTVSWMGPVRTLAIWINISNTVITLRW